jgi:hypothetical protein
MSKRKGEFRQNPFGDGKADASHVEVDSQIFGELAAVDSQVKRIEKINIFSVHPDPGQPRRAVPSRVRNAWNGRPEHVRDMLLVWWGAVQDERSRPFDLGAYLEHEPGERSGNDEENAPDLYNPGPLETAFMTIVDLAASIRRDGLTNPITLDDRNLLETGERRWLAYHLLHFWFDGQEDRPDERSEWERIPARRVDQISVWRQASENNVRADLNAIARARQWSILMMDLHGRQNFKPIEAFESDRDFYAQVADHRVPYGKGEQLLNALGVTSRSAMARYRALLALPDEVWQAGDDLNLAEEMLYNLAQLARTDSRAAIDRYREIVLGQNNSPEKPIKGGDIGEMYSPGTKRHFARTVRAITQAGPGRAKNNARALRELRELRQWLEDQEERILRYME